MFLGGVYTQRVHTVVIKRRVRKDAEDAKFYFTCEGVTGKSANLYFSTFFYFSLRPLCL